MLRKPLPWLLILLTIVLLTGCTSSGRPSRSQQTAASVNGQQAASSPAAEAQTASGIGSDNAQQGAPSGIRQRSGFAGRRATETAAAGAAAATGDQAATPAPVPAVTPAATETASTAATAKVASLASALGTPTDVFQDGHVLTTTAVYLQPDATAEQLGQLETGATLNVTRALGDWYEFVYNEGGVAHAWTPKAAISFANPTDVVPTPAQTATSKGMW